MDLTRYHFSDDLSLAPCDCRNSGKVWKVGGIEVFVLFCFLSDGSSGVVQSEKNVIVVVMVYYFANLPYRQHTKQK